MEKLLVTLLLVVSAFAALASSKSVDKSPDSRLLPVKIEKSGKTRHTEDILRHLGMAKVRSPPNHRKRLATGPAKGTDSHVYVIKLPPNRYYYEKHPLTGHHVASDRNLNRIPVDFKSNGKPAKVYHWNLPLVKKAEKKANQVLKWAREEKMAENKKVSYFRPKKPSKQAFQKYFPGNGRPHSLYIIERTRSKH